MKKIATLSFCIFFLLTVLFGKEIKYPVDEIPSELTKNAKAIIRKNITHFTIQSTHNGKMEVTEAITIMNKSGLDYSVFVQGYNKFFQIRNIKGIYYDKLGNEIKKLKKDKLFDVPAISGYSLYEDNRVIFYDPEIDDFPFTVEYSYTIDFDGFLSYPSWHIYDDYDVSIQNKELSITVPSDTKFRQYYQNLDIKPKIIEKTNQVTYKWNVSDLPAINDEPFSPAIENFSPVLFLAPTDFKIGGNKGNMETWKNFGNWIYELNIDRNIIPEETKAKVIDLVKNAKTDMDKIEILYKYMQDKTRYVNVSVGIGGWQPFEAETVDRLSYGDCKALSNYMKSLLDIVGIKSYYTIVRAGSHATHILSEFPMNQFNHAILCVPLQKDTIWLECTNQRIPAGYIGDFTDDRDVLIIKNNNSELVHTKVYSVEENMQKRSIKFELNGNGEGIADIQTKYIGLGTEEVYSLIDEPHEDIKRYLYRNLKIPDFSIENFNYTVNRNIIAEINETIKVQVKNYSSVMGDRLIVPLNLMNKIDRIPKRVKDRKTDVVIRRSGCEIDSINFVIPEGYSIENVPEGTTITSKFGEYQTELNQNENTISYKRTLSMKKGEYEPEEYEEFRNFLLQISKADNAKFVLVKN
ncbi:MAG: DUF3857 domain-containing protein [Bacteroidales bacterium]|nr:DUF3857 domain-containing protein [Bacteroidales bacterium]